MKQKEGGVLTTDVDVEFEGTIEICVPCIIEAGALVGMIPEDQAEALNDRILELQVWADNAYEELQAKDETIRSLIRVIGNEADHIEALAAGRPVAPEAPEVVLAS